MSALSHRVTSYMWRRRTSFWNRFSPLLSLPCGGFQKSTSAAPLHLHFTRFWVCNPGFPAGKVRTWLTEPSPIFCPTLEVSFLELPPDSEYLSVFQESIRQTCWTDVTVSSSGHLPIQRSWFVGADGYWITSSLW